MYRVLDRAREAGLRTLSDGTELVGHVPHVGRDAWLHVIFAGLSDEDLIELESQAGRALNEQHKRIMRAHNGLILFSTAIYLYGLRRSNARTGDAARQPFGIRVPNRSERPRDTPEDWVFIGGYSTDGSQLCVDTVTSRVYRCARDSAVPLNEWLDVVTMLNEEVGRLALLFDERGVRVRSDLATTP